LLDSSDPFAQIASAYEPSLTLKQPPKWLKRPVGVTFGFGGKLVSFDNKRYTVKVSTIITEPEIVRRSTELESLVESKSLDSFCESRGKNASNEFESENWKVLHTMFNENENAREQLVKHLGFSKDDIVAQITIATKNMSISGSVNTEKTQVETNNDQDVVKRKSVAEAADVPLPTSPIDVKSEKKDYNIVDNSTVKSENIDELFSGSSTSGGPSDASDFFSSEIIPDTFPIHSTTSTYNEQASINKGTFKIYPAQESDVDKLITRSIVLGDFESAVNLCLETDRLSDAVLLAGCGGPELLQKTRKIYFEKKASNVPYLRLLQSIVSEDLSDIVYNADLSEWQEVVAVLCTFARSEDFSGLCNALGQRLEQEYHKLSGSSNGKSKGIEYMKNAVFCYLAAGNLENVVNIWITEQEEEEHAELEHAELEHADQGDAKSSSFRYSLHAKFLQCLIEKVTVFRKAIDYVDPALVQNLDTNTTESNNQQFNLSKLYDKYAEYAEILASQGRLTTALKYLNLTPLEYKKIGSNNIDQLAVIRERLYHSGVDVGSIKAPAFPFEHVYVGAEGETNPSLAPIVGNVDGTTYQPQINPNLYNNQQVAQPPYYNQYAYNQPVAANAPFQPLPPIQQQIQQQPIHQQSPYNNFPPYNAPIQNQPYNPYQPAFPAYNQPQYPDNANLIPPPPVANTNIQNVNPPQQQADVPAAYKKNMPNWNDPPVVSSAKKAAQAQANKLQPITSPFPSTSPALQGTVPPPGVQGFPPNQNIQGTIANFPPPVNRAIVAAPGYQPNSPMSPQAAGNYYPPPPPPKMGAPSQLHTQQMQSSQSPQSHYGPGRSAPTPPPQANVGYQAGGYGGQNTTHASNLVYAAPPPQPPVQPPVQQQAPTQNQQLPAAQLARTPTPAKTPTPVNKHRKFSKVFYIFILLFHFK
jgi:protein transport protein SEC31